MLCKNLMIWKWCQWLRMFLMTRYVSWQRRLSAGLLPNRWVNLEIQTLRGSIKVLKNKIIYYVCEIEKAEVKVKVPVAKKALPGATEEQQIIWNKDIVKAKQDLQKLKDPREEVRKTHGFASNQIKTQLVAIKKTFSYQEAQYSRSKGLPSQVSSQPSVCCIPSYWQWQGEE